MAWIAPVAGAAIGAIGSIIGGSMGQANVASTNATNLEINKETMDWETQMSDTAMQRRVSDLEKAGLNPLLAVGQGGASTPGFSPIAMQSSNAMGQGVSNAAQVGSQAISNRNQMADTSLKVSSAQQADALANEANVRAKKLAGVDTDSINQGIAESQTHQALMLAQADAAGAQAALNHAQVQVAQAQLPKIQAEIQAIGASRTLDEVNAAVGRLSMQMSQLNINQFKSISPSLLESAANAARSSFWNAKSAGAEYELKSLDLPGAINRAAMQQNNPGVAYVDAIANWFHIGANIR